MHERTVQSLKSTHRQSITTLYTLCMTTNLENEQMRTFQGICDPLSSTRLLLPGPRAQNFKTLCRTLLFCTEQNVNVCRTSHTQKKQTRDAWHNPISHHICFHCILFILSSHKIYLSSYKQLPTACLNTTRINTNFIQLPIIMENNQVTIPRRRGSNISNPIVSAMLSSNLMNDCDQVREMFHQCKRSGNHNESIICDTAKRYFESCVQSSGWFVTPTGWVLSRLDVKRQCFFGCDAIRCTIEGVCLAFFSASESASIQK